MQNGGKVTLIGRSRMLPRRSRARRFFLSCACQLTLALRLVPAQSPGTLVIQSGHLGLENAVKAAVFSRDGKLLLTAGGYDAIAVLWDVQTGREIRSFHGHTLSIESVDLSPDLQWALTAGEDTTVRLWNLATGEQAVAINTGSPVKAAKFTPDGNFVVIGGESGPPRLLQAKTLQPVRELKYGGEEITSIATSSKKPIVAVSGSKAIEILDDGTGDLLRVCPQPDDALSVLSFSEDGSRLFGIGQDGVIRIWDPGTGTLLQSVRAVGAIAISADGKKILGADKSGNVLVDAETGKTTRRYLRTLGTFAIFSPSSATFVGSSDAGLKLYSTETGDISQGFDSLVRPVYGASFSTDGRYLATCDGMAYLWDLETGRQIRTFGDLQDTSRVVALSPDAEEIFTGNLQGLVRRWNTANGSEITVNQTDLGKEIKAISFAANGRDWVIQTYYDGTTLITHDELENEKSSAPIPSSQGYASAISPDGKWMITPHGQDVAVWDTEKNHRVELLRHPDSAGILRSTAISNDAAYIATGSYDGRARLWKRDTGVLVKTFEKHENPITSISISDDNRFLLTGSGFMSGGDTTARLWNTETGKEIAVLKGHTAAIRSVLFVPKKNAILTAGEDGTVRFWDEAGKELCSLFSLPHSHWVVVTPDGFFDTDSLDDLQVGQILEKEAPLTPVSLDKYMPYLYEPRLLPRLLEGEDVRAGRTGIRSSGMRFRAKILRIEHARGTDIANVTVRVTPIEKQATSQMQEQLSDVRLFRDGHLVAVKTSESQTASAANDESRDYVFDHIKVPTGDAERRLEFSCYALNRNGIKGDTDRMLLRVPASTAKRAGTAYIVSIGVSKHRNAAWNLRWAASDAATMATTIAQMIQESKQYGHVVSLALTSESDSSPALPTKSRMRSVFEVLGGKSSSEAALAGVPHSEELLEVQPEDIVLVFFAGHGFRSPNGQFFLVPYDAKAWAPEETSQLEQDSVSANELEQWLRPIDARNLTLIIDACYSGAAFQGNGFKPGPMGSRGLGQLAYDKGMQILAASQSNHVAVESNSLRMGLLSYALLKDAVEFASRSQHSVEDMSLRSWFEYAAEQVPRLYQQSFGPAQAGPAAEGQAGRAVVIETDGNQNPANELLQRPGIFDYSQESGRLVIIPGYLNNYDQAGQEAMAKAEAIEKRGGANHLDDALKRYEEAGNWFYEAANLKQCALSFERSAGILKQKGDRDGEAQMSVKAATLFHKAGDEDSTAGALEELAAATYSPKDPTQGLEILSLVLERYRTAGDKEREIAILERIADVYRDAGELLIASCYLDKAKELRNVN